MAITIDGSANKLEIGANATGSSFLRLYEDTDNGSNYIDVTAPSSFGSNRVLTLPDATTTLVGTDATQTLSNKTINGGTIQSGTTVTNPTSPASTSIDFTGIPSWVKKITVMFSGISVSGTSNIQIQIGDSGGFETTSYSSASVQLVGSAAVVGLASTSGFLVTAANTAAATHNGNIMIALQSSNLWTHSANLYNTAGAINSSAGSKTLSDTLTQVRITTVNGTDTFDAGTVNILYE
jgi:hypothetical protein